MCLPQAAQNRIRDKEDLQRRQEKVSRKFITPRVSVAERERETQQLSPGYLEGALEEVYLLSLTKES